MTPPVEPAAARVLQSLEQREAPGRMLTHLRTGGAMREVLAAAIANVKSRARNNGLTDADVDAEIAAWRVAHSIGV